jgi:hypothetical protein
MSELKFVQSFEGEVGSLDGTWWDQRCVASDVSFLSRPVDLSWADSDWDRGHSCLDNILASILYAGVDIMGALGWANSDRSSGRVVGRRGFGCSI